MEKKIQLVNQLVEMGYALFDWTVEDFAATFTEEQLLQTIEKFTEYRKRFPELNGSR